MRSHLAAAWKLTSTATLIKKFNFIPSFFETLILSVTILWQTTYFMVDIFDKQSEALDILRNFSTGLFQSGHGFQVVISVLIIAGVYLFFSFLLKNIFVGGLVHLIRAYFLRQSVQYRWLPAISRGLKSCLVLIEYQALFAWANVTYLIYIFIWGQRFLEGQRWGLVFIIAFIYLIIVTVMAVLFAYTRFFIILENRPVFQSLGMSMDMAITHLDTTIKLIFSLVLVYVRLIIVLIGIMILPSFLGVIIAMELAQMWITLTFIVIGLVYTVFLIIVAHINSILEIFIETLWFSFYMENKYLDRDET